jgi:vitamin B12 transporter
MNTIARPVLLALACATSLPALGNDRLEEIIVTSSRVEMPLRQIGTSVSVLTRADIEQRGFTNLAEVLRYAPAISVTNTGGQGKATSLRIRGEQGFRTKVLMDGIDITDVSRPQAAPSFEHLMSAGIERVEILRGPQGLMYGADAGGVVSITTLRPDSNFGGGVSAEVGRYGTQQLGAHIGGDNGVFDYGLFGNAYETDGFNSRTTDTDPGDDDGYENNTLHGRIGWQISEDWRTEIVGHAVDGDNEYDDCFTVDTFAPTNRCSDDFTQDSWRGLVEQRGERFSNLLAYSQSKIEREFFSEGKTSWSSEGELDKAEYTGSWTGSDQLRLVYGAELITESLDNPDGDSERDQKAYYLEYQGELASDFFLTAGIRHDDNDDFGSHTTYRVSAAYVIPGKDGEFKLKATYGTGFRAPSLYEIAYNDGPFAAPPASGTELDAEESEGYDFGVAYYANSGWYLEAIYFDQRIEDEIFFDLVAFSGYLQEDGESESRGVELIGEWPMAYDFALSGNYTYNDTENAEGLPRLRVPEQLANVGLSYRPWEGRLDIHLFLRVARDAVDGGGVELDDYELLNLTASYRLLESLEIYARVENLTDEDYQEVPTFNTSGRAGYAGLRFTF